MTRADAILLLMEKAEETGRGVREAIASTAVPLAVALAVLLGIYPVARSR